MNMTNLHFHGLHVSPDAPQDDVITMMAMPGPIASLHGRYSAQIKRQGCIGITPILMEKAISRTLMACQERL